MQFSTQCIITHCDIRKGCSVPNQGLVQIVIKNSLLSNGTSFIFGCLLVIYELALLKPSNSVEGLGRRVHFPAFDRGSAKKGLYILTQ